MTIDSCYTKFYIVDKRVVVKRCGDKKLKSKQLKSYIESEDGYDADVTIINCDDRQAVIELETYSGMTTFLAS